MVAVVFIALGIAIVGWLFKLTYKFILWVIAIIAVLFILMSIGLVPNLVG